MKNSSEKEPPVFRIYLTDMQQCAAVEDLLISESAENKNIDRIYLNADLFYANPDKMKMICEKMRASCPGIDLWLGMPKVLRKQDEPYLREIDRILMETPFLCGALCENLEAVGYFREQFPECLLLADHAFYLWNNESVRAWDDQLAGACLPLELTAKEQMDLLKSCVSMKRLCIRNNDCGHDALAWDKVVFGRIPFMQTANCIAKTRDACRKKQALESVENAIGFLRDRTGAAFPVLMNCIHCHNTIYNSVPMSLHGDFAKWAGLAGLRIHFTIESYDEAKKIAKWFLCEDCAPEKMPFDQFTRGHEKRGVL